MALGRRVRGVGAECEAREAPFVVPPPKSPSQGEKKRRAVDGLSRASRIATHLRMSQRSTVRLRKAPRPMLRYPLFAAIFVHLVSFSNRAFAEQAELPALPPPATAHDDTRPASPKSEPVDPAVRVGSTPSASGAPDHADTALVHIDGEAGMHLQRNERGGSRKTWTDACVSPCDIELPTAFDYRISGGPTRPSQPFTLRAQTGSAKRSA